MSMQEIEDLYESPLMDHTILSTLQLLMQYYCMVLKSVLSEKRILDHWILS